MGAREHPVASVMKETLAAQLSIDSTSLQGSSPESPHLVGEGRGRGKVRKPPALEIPRCIF